MFMTASICPPISKKVLLSMSVCVMHEKPNNIKVSRVFKSKHTSGSYLFGQIHDNGAMGQMTTLSFLNT